MCGGGERKQRRIHLERFLFYQRERVSPRAVDPNELILLEVRSTGVAQYAGAEVPAAGLGKARLIACEFGGGFGHRSPIAGERRDAGHRDDRFMLVVGLEGAST